MSEENKVIDKVNTSEIVEQPVDAEEIPPVKTEAIPPVNTEPTHPLQPPVEPAQKLEDITKRLWRIVQLRKSTSRRLKIRRTGRKRSIRSRVFSTAVGRRNFQRRSDSF